MQSVVEELDIETYNKPAVYEVSTVFQVEDRYASHDHVSVKAARRREELDLDVFGELEELEEVRPSGPASVAHAAYLAESQPLLPAVKKRVNPAV